MSRGEAARGESRVCSAAVSAPGLACGPLPQVLGGAHRGPFCLPNAEEPRGALRTGSGSGRGRAAFPLCPCVQGLSHTATRPRGRRSRGRSRGTSRTLVLGPASPSRKLSPPAGPVPDGVRDPWVRGGVVTQGAGPWGRPTARRSCPEGRSTCRACQYVPTRSRVPQPPPPLGGRSARPAGLTRPHSSHLPPHTPTRSMELPRTPKRGSAGRALALCPPPRAHTSQDDPTEGASVTGAAAPRPAEPAFVRRC